MSSTSHDPMVNEELVREMSDAIWGADGSPEAIDDYFAEDVVAHEPGQTIEGRDAYRAYEEELRRGFPDLNGTVNQVICQDDLVSVRYTASGTHLGELWGIEPTRESGKVSGQVIYRIEDEKVVETWHEFDQFGMMQQLGVIPENMSE